MIEIHCTETQKRRIIQALEAGMTNINDATCLFPRKAAFCGLDSEASCKNCLATKIKWVTKK